MSKTMNPDRPWLVGFLRTMSVRPGAYIGSENIAALELFITAYTLARTDLGVPEFGSGEETLLVDFQLWLQERLRLHDTRGWPGLIEKADPSPRNVHTFLRLFDQFLREAAGVPDGLAVTGTEATEASRTHE